MRAIAKKIICPKKIDDVVEKGCLNCGASSVQPLNCLLHTVCYASFLRSILKSIVQELFSTHKKCNDTFHNPESTYTF